MLVSLSHTDHNPGSLMKSNTYLVLELGQLETIKVSQVSTNLALFELLGPGSLSPLLDGLVLLQSLLESGLTDSTGKVLEDKRSQNHTTEGESLTSDTGGRTIDESLMHCGCIRIRCRIY